MAKASTSSLSATNPTIYDGNAFHDTAEILAERFNLERVTINYPALKQALEKEREKEGFRPATSNTILLSNDPRSEGQLRFQSMLKHCGFDLSITHYRDTFVSLPPGRSPQDTGGRPLVSFGPQLAYIAGLMARHANPHFLVVSHCFELFVPLFNLAERIKGADGRVGLAFFGSLLDYRWRATGLLEGKLGVTFIDLDQHGEAIAGIDLVGHSKQSTDTRAGLNRF